MKKLEKKTKNRGRFVKNKSYKRNKPKKNVTEMEESLSDSCDQKMLTEKETPNAFTSSSSTDAVNCSHSHVFEEKSAFSISKFSISELNKDTIRWQDYCDNPIREAQRIESYKIKRRERYYSTGKTETAYSRYYA